MPNLNTPFGFRPIKYLSGAAWTGGTNIYYIASDNTDAFYPGDPVLSSGTGDANGVPGIGIGVAGTAIRGILISAGPVVANANASGGGSFPGGPYINASDLTRIAIPASKTVAYYAAVMDDPNVICECMEVYSGTAFAATEIGLNCNFVIAAPATGAALSGTTLNNATEAGTSTLNCKILRLSPKGSNAYGIGAVWEVLLNNHELRAGITGV